MESRDTNKRSTTDASGNEVALKKVKTNRPSFPERGHGSQREFGRGHGRGSSFGGRVGHGARGTRPIYWGEIQGINQRFAMESNNRMGRGFAFGGGRGMAHGVGSEVTQGARRRKKRGGRGRKLCKMEGREAKKNTHGQSGNVFLGYPGWCRWTLLLFLRKASVYHENKLRDWSKFRYPGRSWQQCDEVWQKLGKEVQPNMDESIDSVKRMLMQILPALNKKKVMSRIAARPKGALDFFAENKNLGSLADEANYSRIYEMYGSLKEGERAEYEVLFGDTCRMYHRELFNYFKNEPERLRTDLLAWRISTCY